MSDREPLGYFQDFLHRLRSGMDWVAAQFWGVVLILAAGLAWTRLPDKYAWQVILSLLIPLLLAAALLVLEARTMRRLLNQEEERAPLATGVLMLLAWASVVWMTWAVLNWCSDQIPLWAGYLNSQLSAHWRARIFTYNHIQTGLTVLIWILRWIVIPGKVIPHAVASAQWGWRLPESRLLRMMLNWRWWPAVSVAALAGVALPGHFFATDPKGAVSHQVWTVILKMTGGYLLAVTSCAALLVWCAVLLARQAEPAKGALDHELFSKLRRGWKWILVLAIWFLPFELASAFLANSTVSLASGSLIIAPIVAVVFPLLFFILQVAYLRSMIGPSEKRVRMIWGILMFIAWVVPGFAVFLFVLYHAPISLQFLCRVFLPGLLLPFALASAEWGAQLPWRRVLRILANWRWWLGILAVATYGFAVPALLMSNSADVSPPSHGEIFPLRMLLSSVLRLGSSIFILAWFAVLLDRNRKSAESREDDAPAQSESTQLPLSESGDNVSGNS